MLPELLPLDEPLLLDPLLEPPLLELLLDEELDPLVDPLVEPPVDPLVDPLVEPELVVPLLDVLPELELDDDEEEEEDALLPPSPSESGLALNGPPMGASAAPLQPIQLAARTNAPRRRAARIVVQS